MVRDRSRDRLALWLALLALLALGTAPTVSRVLAAERGAGPLTILCTSVGWRVVALAAGTLSAGDHTPGAMAGGDAECPLCLVAAPVLPPAGSARAPAAAAGAAAPHMGPSPAAPGSAAFALAQPRGPPGFTGRTA